MSEIIETPTAEEIARHFSACMDIVNLLNAGQPEGMTAEDWADTVERNKAHLVLMLAKTFWTNQDLTAIRAASV
jgi:hypothetical protein